MIDDLMRSLDAMVPDEPAAWISIVCLPIIIINSIICVSAVRLRPSFWRAAFSAALGMWATVVLATKIETWHTSPLHLLLHLSLAGNALTNLAQMLRERREAAGGHMCNEDCRIISCSVVGCPYRQPLPVFRAGVERPIWLGKRQKEQDQ